MHDEPILRCQPGGDEPYIPQQSGCGGQKVSLRRRSSKTLSYRWQERKDTIAIINCHHRFPRSDITPTSHCIPTALRSSPTPRDAKSRYGHALAAQHTSGTEIKAVSQQGFTIVDLRARFASQDDS
jgi:hypothetical protein